MIDALQGSTPCRSHQPRNLVHLNWYKATVERWRSEAVTHATAFKKPAFWISHWTTSTREVGRFRSLAGTSACGTEPVSSTLTEVQGVRRPAGIEGRQTTPSGTTMEPTKPKRPVERRTLDRICLNRANCGMASADRWYQGCWNESCFQAI